MTIHHDKLAYGKIASLTEEFSEEKLAKMAETLSGGGPEKEKNEKERPCEEDKK